MIYPGYKVGLLVLLITGGCAWVAGQDRSNPFEITSRLPEVDRAEGGQEQRALTPFDIRPGRTSPNPAPLSTSIAPAAAPATPPGGTGIGWQRGPLVIQSSEPSRREGAVLAIHLILLVALASVWLLFGQLLAQVFRGTLNENLMNQIYTRRSGGEETALRICYLFFFLTAGFHLHLLTGYHGLGLGLNTWVSWLTYALIVAALAGVKQLLVATLGWLFPIRQDASKYAFVLMVFSILIGILLVPVNLGVSYAPAGARGVFLYGGLLTVALLYGLHLARGLLVAGSLVTTRPLHLVLYICAVEIAPLLLFYRYLSNTLAWQ